MVKIAKLRQHLRSANAPTLPHRSILAEREPDGLYRQIVHELSHIFAFDIIPRSSANIRRVPAWIDEGFAEYMRLWLTTDGDAQAAAPEFTKFFEGEFLAAMPKVRKAMDEARDAARRWRMQGAQERARASMIDTASPGRQMRRGLGKIRDLATMEKWMSEGAAKATDGCRVESDGRCPHGKKSWLLVLGLI